MTDLKMTDLEFFEISHGSYQPLNFLPYSTLSTQYPILKIFHRLWRSLNVRTQQECETAFQKSFRKSMQANRDVNVQ